MSKINQLKSDIISALPYAGTGVVATLPIDMPFWSMLGGVVGLGLFISKMRHFRQKYYQLQLSDLTAFENKDIQLVGDKYLLSLPLAKKWRLLPILPCTITDEEYNIIGANVQQMFMSLFSQYNTEKNIPPKKAAYKALCDVFQCVRNNNSVENIFCQSHEKDNQVQMMGCYHLANLYQDVKRCQHDADVIDLFHQIYHHLIGRLSDYKLSRLFIHENDIQFAVNQTVRKNSMVSHLRGLFLASTMLTCATVGSFAHDMYAQNDTYNTTKYLGLTSLGVLGLWGYQRRRHLLNELKRFDTDNFAIETSEPTNQTTEGEATIYHEKVTMLAPAHKLRLVIQKNNDLLTMIHENNVTNVSQLLTCVQKDRQTFKRKHEQDESIRNILKSGYTLEDVIQFYGPERASESLVQLCIERGLSINRFVGIDTYKDQLQQRYTLFSNHWNFLKNLEEEHEVPLTYQSFSNDKNIVFTVDRKIVLVHQIHPAVHDMLVNTRG